MPQKINSAWRLHTIVSRTTGYHDNMALSSFDFLVAGAVFLSLGELQKCCAFVTMPIACCIGDCMRSPTSGVTSFFTFNEPIHST